MTGMQSVTINGKTGTMAPWMDGFYKVRFNDGSSMILKEKAQAQDMALSITAFDDTHEHYAGEFESLGRIGGKNLSKMTAAEKAQAVLKAKKILQPAVQAKKSAHEIATAKKLLSVTSGKAYPPAPKAPTAPKLSITKAAPASKGPTTYFGGVKIGDMTTSDLNKYGLKAAKILQPAQKASPEQKEAAAKFLMASHQAMQKHIDAYPELAAKYGAVAQKGKSGTNKGQSYSTQSLGITEGPKGTGAVKEKFTYPMQHLTAEEQKAVKIYTGSGYHGINSALREGDTNKWGYGPKIKALEAAINKHEIPQATTLYRGISKESYDSMFGENIQIGSIVKDKGFVSTSTSQSFAEGWKSHGVTLHISMPKGAKGMNVEKISSVGSIEHEVILQHGSKFEVVSVHPKSGGKPPIVKVKYVA